MTISLCMIVKNEEQVLARCLDTVADLVDEIIIVDTGSTDATREVAEQYTSLIYDFEWCDDFAAARNFSFSKATMDYIYAPDADEVLDETNRERFRRLKRELIPEIEIVQMHYVNANENETVLNSKTELRPKLFKRLRNFTWTDPIHEIVRLDPVVFDSDIEILHMPMGVHGKRDFGIFKKAIARDGRLSKRLVNMYARELLKTGNEKDFEEARDYFKAYYEENDGDQRKWAECVLARHYRLEGNEYEFMKMALCDMATTPCSEICCELGDYYMGKDDLQEGLMWYKNAAFETAAVLDIHAQGDYPLKAIVKCYEIYLEDMKKTGGKKDIELAENLLKEARETLSSWELPDKL